MKEIQYQIYKLNKREWFFVVIKAVVLTFLLAYLFFDSIFAMPIFVPVIVFLSKREAEIRKRQRIRKLSSQFRDGILSVSSALGAGYSVENAFKEALKDLRFLYNSQEYIILELQYIVNGIAMNQSIETLLYEFARRSGLEDIEMFAEVFSVCKRTGGDMVTIIGECASRINEKIEVYREIDTFLSAKKLEQKIMNAMPMGILLYVRFSSPDFLEGLYKNLVGVIVMTLCLGVYAGAYMLAQKIMAIEV